ncbi:hypothetical protein BJV77DRAFT_298087 [Russula vinacea]|nr:hypothetical protein BJV77DRAFT_298087 [Russula vinacea]
MVFQNTGTLPLCNNCAGSPQVGHSGHPNDALFFYAFEKEPGPLAEPICVKDAIESRLMGVAVAINDLLHPFLQLLPRYCSRLLSSGRESKVALIILEWRLPLQFGQGIPLSGDTYFLLRLHLFGDVPRNGLNLRHSIHHLRIVPYYGCTLF